jgi:hypothetical protein
MHILSHAGNTFLEINPIVLELQRTDLKREAK